MNTILSTDKLTKQFGKHRAVDGASIEIRPGDIYGLIGRNGAGKTTLLKMVSGLSKPTSGTYSLFGKDGKCAQLLSRVGILIEEPGLFPNLTAAENIRLKCIALGVREANVVEELLELVDLKDTGKKQVRRFSMGMKQRLGLALALVGNPDLVILDEPINGLDPQGIAAMRLLIDRLNRERKITFLISSHILEELSKIATKYGIIHQGNILQELTREELHERCREHIVLRTDDNARAATVLESMGIHNFKAVDAESIQVYDHLDAGGDITLRLAEAGIKTYGIAIQNEGLENYFLKLTGGVQNA